MHVRTLMQKARKAIRNEKSKSLTNWVSVKEGGKCIKVEKYVCHSSIKYEDDAEVIVDFIHFDVGHRSKFLMSDWKTYRRAVEWIVNKSPWRDAFLEHKKFDAIYKNGIALNLDSNFFIMAGGFTAIRSLREYKNRLPVYAKVIKMGYDDTVAFIVSNSIYYDESSRKLIPLLLDNHHSALPQGTGSVDKISKFFSTGLEPINKKSFREGWNSFQIFENFQDKNAASIFGLIEKFVEKTKDKGFGNYAFVSDNALRCICAEVNKAIIKNTKGE